MFRFGMGLGIAFRRGLLDAQVSTVEDCPASWMVMGFRVRSIRHAGFFAILLLAAGCGGLGGDATDSGDSISPGDSRQQAEDVSSTPAKSSRDPYAVPTDAQCIQDVIQNGNGVLEVIPSERPGNKSWSSIHDQYFWERGLTLIKESNQFGEAANVRCIIGGFARYEITAGRYNYREFKTLWVEYEGVPRPTDDEVLAFVNSKLKKFLGGKAARMVNPETLRIEIAPADEQKYTWHSPKSMSLNLVVHYDNIESTTEVASYRSLWECRLYRDDKDSPWKDLIGTEDSSQKVELQRQKLEAEDIRALKTLKQFLIDQASS